MGEGSRVDLGTGEQLAEVKQQLLHEGLVESLAALGKSIVQAVVDCLRDDVEELLEELLLVVVCEASIFN